MGITLKNFIFQKMLLKVKKRTAETAGVTVISIVSFSLFFSNSQVNLVIVLITEQISDIFV